MLLNLTQQQAAALDRELERAAATDPDVLAVRDKLARGLGPTTVGPDPRPDDDRRSLGGSVKKDPTKQPVSGLYGWGAAETILKRCQDNERRKLLIELVRQGGVQGAPALGYFARLLRWHADEGPAPVAPEKLTGTEIAYCETRVRALLQPYVDAGDNRLAGRLQAIRPRSTAA